MHKVLTLICVLLILIGSTSYGYSPKDPVVTTMLEKATRYLENPPVDQVGNRIWMDQMGGRVLTAYAIYKYRKDNNHTSIGQATGAIQKFLDSEFVLGNKEVYAIGVALSFLTEFDDPQSQRLGVQLYERLLKHQHKNGAFAYEGHGDTSVTQYAILGMWSVKNANIIPNFNTEPVERACNWLLRTQAPAGNWAYHGKDPGAYTRIEQPDRPSLACFTAGAGSLYICADVLGIEKKAPLFTPASKSADPNRPANPAVDRGYFWNSVSLADQFWSKERKLEALKWHYYYMYGQERYLSVRSKIHKLKEPTTGPGWYNDGVDYLARKQRKDGSWNFTTHPPPVIDTAFAVLFLARSTKDKLPTLASGVASSGLGIPENFEQAIQTEDGEIVAPAKYSHAEKALIRAVLAENFDAVSVELGGLIIRNEREKSALDILREQVKHPSHEVRLSTVRVLARGGLENAPILIYALSDPDDRIMQEARDALRLASRKLGGFGLLDDADEAQKRTAQRRWSEWLRSVRPDLEF